MKRRKLMSLLGIILLLIIAAVSGALGQAIVGYSVGGWLITTLVGFIGALIGTWLARALGLPFMLPVTLGGQTFPVIWAVIGSAIFAVIVGYIRKYRGRLLKI
jgi:uncharacterized membrane protein YeaQ/YmgE (transglycosylase-associated protein family)